MDTDDRRPFYYTPADDRPGGGFDARHVDAINRMISDRGWIVNAFAQVEYLLADTVVRCSTLDQYREVDTSLPYRLDQRVARFVALLPVAGPLADQRDEFERIVRDFEAAEERRQFLVHGFASFHFTPGGDMAMRFDRFMPARSEPSRRRSMWFRPETLARIKEEASASSTFALNEFVRLHKRLGWVGD